MKSLPYLTGLLVAAIGLSTFAMPQLASARPHSAVRKNDVTVPGCSTVLSLGRNIYKQSKPHRACTAINCPIDYFEKFPSLLVNESSVPRKFSASLVDKKGNSLATCGQLDCRDCSKGFRYVCRGNTNSFAKTAKARTGSYAVYYKAGSTCIAIPDIGKCVGSVKGLCNQTLH